MNEHEATQIIAETLRGIAPEVDLALCDLDRPFGEQVDLDSMDLLELLTGVSERAGVEIPDGLLPAGWTLGDLVAVLVPSPDTATR